MLASRHHPLVDNFGRIVATGVNMHTFFHHRVRSCSQCLARLVAAWLDLRLLLSWRRHSAGDDKIVKTTTARSLKIVERFAMPRKMKRDLKGHRADDAKLEVISAKLEVIPERDVAARSSQDVRRMVEMMAEYWITRDRNEVQLRGLEMLQNRVKVVFNAQRLEWGLSVQLSGGGFGLGLLGMVGPQCESSAQHCHAAEESEWAFHGHFQLGEAKSLDSMDG